MVNPTTLKQAASLYDELKTQRDDSAAAMAGIMQRHEQHKGKHAPLSTNDADAFDRLDNKCDELDGNLRSLAEQYPSLGQPRANGTVPDLVWPEGVSYEPQPEGGYRKVTGATSGEGSLVNWASDRRSSGDFTSGHASEFSLGKYIRGAVTGQWQDADLERRALAEGTDSTGGYLVPTMLSASVIDKLKPATRVLQAGARVEPLDSDTLDIARISTGVTAGWRAENAAVAESDPGFDRVQLKPKSLAVLTKLSAEMFEDLSDSGLQAIEDELTRSLAVEVDRAALLGTGSSNQPTGVLSQTGVTLRSNGANGTSVSWGIVGDAVAQLRNANVEPTGFIWSPRTTASLTALADSTGQPLRAPESLAAIPKYDTNSVPNDVTVGNASTCSYIFAGDWSQLVIGVRPSLRVRVISDASYALDKLQVTLVASLRADIAVLRPAAFVVEQGVKA
jgi:HK97 family phage major capsid protein